MNTDKRILVTGATGYLGHVIVRYAVENGYTARALCRSVEKADGFSNRVEVAQGNILDPSSLRAAMKDCDAVIHTAGLVSIWQRDPNDFFRVNVEGTKEVLNAAREMGVARIVYTSSFFALGPTTEKPADESWQNTGAYKPTLYAQSKAEAHRVVQQWASDGNDVVTVYPALIYGPGKDTQGNHVTALVRDYIQKRIPGIPGKGDKRWTYSYIDDVAKGHLLALENAKPGDRFILGGEDATVIELFEILHSLTKIKPPSRKIPLGIIRGLSVLDELRARWSGNYLPKLTPDMVGVYEQHWRYSSQKAITELGYIRTPLKIGIIKTLESLGFELPQEHRTIL